MSASHLPHDELLTAAEAARRLGMARTTLYQWLAESNAGQLLIQGQPVTIDYLQSGPRGQGAIRIEAGEVQRLRELLRVRPKSVPPRRRPIARTTYPGITVPLGRPD
jgi:hypothetical protein